MDKTIGSYLVIVLHVFCVVRRTDHAGHPTIGRDPNHVNRVTPSTQRVGQSPVVGKGCRPDACTALVLEPDRTGSVVGDRLGT